MALSKFSGVARAFGFAYGINAGAAPLQVIAGPAASGAGTITLAYGVTYSVDGLPIYPTTTTPLLVGSGAEQELVTPTAVSNPTPSQYGTCQITATFANLHGQGDVVASGSAGIVEALNFANSIGGGLVAAEYACLAALTTTHALFLTTIHTYKSWANVVFLDWTAPSGTGNVANSWYAGSATAPSNGGVLTNSTIQIY